MNYVIIGNGAAGVTAAETLRKLDNDGKITIITAERYPAYSKCLLSDYLAGDYSEKRLFFRDDAFYNRLGIQVLFNHRVHSLDFHRKIIKTVNANYPAIPGSKLPYDRLLIASGSKSLAPGFVGKLKNHLHFLNTLDDANGIIGAANKAREAVIIGAGFVGVETAFNLRKRGLKVTLVEKADRILPAQLDETAAGIIGHALESEGIRVCLGAGTTEIIQRHGFLKPKGIQGMVLENGEFIPGDLLVSAAGSIPNLDFITPGTLEVRRGIIVNRRMATSAPDVYAAGDVVENIRTDSGGYFPAPVWPNAVIGGEYAAYNMTGLNREVNQLSGMQNAAEFREIPLISIGFVDATGPEVETLVDYRPVQGIYRKIIVKHGRIIGMIFLGDIRQSGVVGALLKTQTPVDDFKNDLLNPNFGFSQIMYRFN